MRIFEADPATATHPLRDPSPVHPFHDASHNAARAVVGVSLHLLHQCRCSCLYSCAGANELHKHRISCSVGAGSWGARLFARCLLALTTALADAALGAGAGPTCCCDLRDRPVAWRPDASDSRHTRLAFWLLQWA